MKTLLNRTYVPILLLCLGFSEMSHCAKHEKIKPQDDLYHFVNESWLKNTTIPKDKNIYTIFQILGDENDQKLADLVKNLIQEPISKKNADTLNIVNLYQSFLAENCLESLGLMPLKKELAQIDSIETHHDLLKVMAYLHQIGVSLPFALGVSQDMKHTNQYILGLYQSGLGLPDKEYYLSSAPTFLKTQKNYLQHIAQVFTLADLNHVHARAYSVFELEKKLAASHWSRVESRDYDKIYNKYAIAKLEELTPDIQWTEYLKEFNIPTKDLESIMVYQPSVLSEFNSLLYKMPLEDWKNYLRFRLLSAYAPYLDHRFVNTHFEFYGKQLSGLIENKTREKRGIDLVNGALADVLGALYVKQYFPPESKKQMDHLVQNLKQSFKLSLEQNTWMTPKTREAALLKLSKLTTKIGYPNQWKTYKGLVFKPDTLVENIMQANIYEFNRDIKKLNTPVDRDEWHMSPQTVNAYYSPNMNEIVFPAAILQAPFFDNKAPNAKNYGAIGAIIGHEISHAFDDQGRKFDGEGNLKNWWTPEDIANFSRHTHNLIKQYAQYEPIKGSFINGELTLGENIADISGLSVAYHAFKLAEPSNNQHPTESLYPDQLFFISWAEIWKNKIRPEALQQRLITDPHSPGLYRANGAVKNIDAFYKTFNVNETHKMYLPPSDRINLWSFGTG